MPLTFEQSEPDPIIADVSIFVSASIPDATRWDGPFDALEITDAIVALARCFLTAGARLVTAAHPTIAPLLLYVAAELPDAARGRIVVYQSEIFESVLPPATRRFEEEGFGELVWTPAVSNETSDPGNRAESLSVMRRQMLVDTQPQAAVFVGGMTGILEEWQMFAAERPGDPRYPIGYPGGEARYLAEQSPRGTGPESRPSSPLGELLQNGAVYPMTWNAVLDDLRSHLSPG